MLAVAQKPKEFASHPVDDDWRDRVKSRLKARGAQAKLVRHLTEVLGRPVSTGQLSEVLGGKYDTSPLVGPIHQYFGWPAPLMPVQSLDLGEVDYLARRIAPEDRVVAVAALEAISGLSGEEAKRTIVDLVALIRSRQK